VITQDGARVSRTFLAKDAINVWLVSINIPSVFPATAILMVQTENHATMKGTAII
jgi:hypothetical protein